MDLIATNVPALILIGAIVLPVLVYLLLGAGERVISLVGPRWTHGSRALLWLAIPLILVGLVLVYPLLRTVVGAFQDRTGQNWVGLDNFAWLFSDQLSSVLFNTLLWMTVYPAGTVVLALIAAALFDRMRSERLAITIVLLPSAVSFAAASIIWRQIYAYQPAGREQKSLLNALVTLIPGVEPIAWLQTPFLNTFALMFVATWASLGVSVVILSAAIKNVPAETLEAARLDGAGEVYIFVRIVLPQILPAVLVVATTKFILALKIFDIVHVMTNGNFSSDILANRMYLELFAANERGHASAIAVILLLAAAPIAIINIRQFRSEAAR